MSYSLNKELLTEILSIFSPSGNEGLIRHLIEEEIKDYVDEIHTDALGNLIARKKGNGRKVMVAGHMDQIGMMITYIDDHGFLRFTNVGGLSPAVCYSQRVIFENGTIGVVGTEKLDSLKDLTLEKLFIDIGASTREEAEKLVSIGDTCVYYSEPLIDDKKVISPAMDDRIGCFIMIEAIKKINESPYDLYFVFTVQEEVGIRGAKTSAYAINPDYGIALDVTSTGDTPKAKTMAVKLGNGPAIKVRDNSLLCHPKIKNHMVKQAKAHNIPYQMEVLEFGGTDSGSIHLTREGVPSGVLSIPTRYIHTDCEMCHITDIANSIELTAKILEAEIEA
ncbi:M42 family metallopeptidase [Alkaliphilus serpentinus]|uniref:M42 family metallopeptidase n=1 Tax=Alkaliphilus serpentinus TaxID=1482731 RepID=A0A833HL79_9FIRM|nr:M42 family metallopeptidase [Alkaliphilus serpentinus]KAB3524943.1 M42 family metallopeptidase [Alkaliphilus serpentinus]